MVDQRLKIPLQMSPAPLQPPLVPIHLRPVAIHHAVEGVREQFLKDRGGARGPQRKDRVGVGDEDPQPGLEPGFLRRRFVDAQNVFGRQLLSQFLVGRREGGRRLILQLDHPTRRAGLIEHLFQKQGHPPLALLETAHEQSGQGE